MTFWGPKDLVRSISLGPMPATHAACPVGEEQPPPQLLLPLVVDPQLLHFRYTGVCTAISTHLQIMCRLPRGAWLASTWQERKDLTVVIWRTMALVGSYLKTLFSVHGIVYALEKYGLAAFAVSLGEGLRFQKSHTVLTASCLVSDMNSQLLHGCPA